ncbi:hypothetical protein X975_06261, partial [Stegodyphus mimosarum]
YCKISTSLPSFIFLDYGILEVQINIVSILDSPSFVQSLSKRLYYTKTSERNSPHRRPTEKRELQA